MGSILYFEEDLYPAKENGVPDTSKEPVTVEIFTSTFWGPAKVFLRTSDSNGKETTLVLTKEQVQGLYDGIDEAGFYTGDINRE